MNRNIMPLVFQSERFFREAWPQISQSVESATDAASDVQWIAGVVGLETGARVLDAPVRLRPALGRVRAARLRHDRRGLQRDRARAARARRPARRMSPRARVPGHSRHGVPERVRSGGEPLQLDRLLLRGRGPPRARPLLARASSPAAPSSSTPRNRDQCVRSLPPEERMRRGSSTIRVENEFDPTTSRWRARWWRLKRASAKSAEGPPELIGESEIRLYSAHELLHMLRPGALAQGRALRRSRRHPFSLDTHRLVVVAWK